MFVISISVRNMQIWFSAACPKSSTFLFIKVPQMNVTDIPVQTILLYVSMFFAFAIGFNGGFRP